jgi:hypothetical protein
VLDLAEAVSKVGWFGRGAQRGLPGQQSPHRRRVTVSNGCVERLHAPFILMA